MVTNTEINVGDILRVTRKDGRVYDCFVVEDVDRHGIFCGRVIQDVKGKSPTTSWGRYGLRGNAICQIKTECQSIQVLSKSKQVPAKNLEHVEIYRSKVPGSDKVLTFCLSEDLGRHYGGWSDTLEESEAILESYTSSKNHLQLGRLLESLT